MSLNINLNLNKPDEPDLPKWQHYKCSRPSTRLITTKGTRVTFTKFAYMTQDPDVIAYLDKEIALGLNVITKGELLTAEDSDPMNALRRKHVAEYLAEQVAAKEASARGETRDMGGTEGGASALKVATTKHVAN